MNKRAKEQIEEVLEKSMFASRWFMAPVYIVLSASLAVIMLKVIQEFTNYLPLFLDLKISCEPFPLIYIVEFSFISPLKYLYDITFSISS